MKGDVSQGPLERDTRAALRNIPGYAEGFLDEIASRPLSVQIAVLRRLFGKTQSEMARSLGLKQTHISRLEKTGADHRVSFFERAAAKLGARLALIPPGVRLVPEAGFMDKTHSMTAEPRRPYRARRKAKGRP